MALRASNKVEPGFSLSSMSDLVFLLLIFFVIVSTMVSPFALPVDLPKASRTTPKEPPKVAVRIDADNRILLNNTPVAEARLEEALTAEMAKHTAQDAIILRVANSTPTGLMVTVLDLAKRNKWRIVLASLTP
ncbi:MAG: biopolymer transporter ExbD [Flavobacteriales bacterium]|nr:biopolymer transporter ExbD [Flavobacteriales bacterium]